MSIERFRLRGDPIQHSPGGRNRERKGCTGQLAGRKTIEIGSVRSELGATYRLFRLLTCVSPVSLAVAQGAWRT